MSQFKTKEKYEGLWFETGSKVSFNREWGGVRFTDEQCEALLNGDMIQFTAVNKSGKEYQAYGTLEAQTFETTDPDGNPRTVNYIGFRNRSFDPEYDTQGREMPPAEFAGHTFSDEQREKLANGERIFVDSFVSHKSGEPKPFAATVSFDHDPARGRKKIALHFGN